MDNTDKHDFAIGKYDRDLRYAGLFFARVLRIALLVLVLAVYWEWNHPDPGIELTMIRERSLASANVHYFLVAFGLLGTTAMIAAAVYAILGHGMARERRSTLRGHERPCH